MKIVIGWLYPDLMSTYGDRGNIICLKKRCEWRGIEVKIINIESRSKNQELRAVDLIFGGGAQDRQQEIVMRDLKGEKGKIIKEMIENEVPALFVCGAPQLMGHYYEPAFGQRIEGLGIFDMVSIHPGPDKPRCIGNIVAKISDPNYPNPHPNNANEVTNNLEQKYSEHSNEIRRLGSRYIVGFENHGGRTYLGKNVKPFARVIKGFGNNGEDGTEGVVYKNSIGCYFHGPFLPKNPHVADFLIKKALEVKYKKEIELAPLDDTLEWQAQEFMLRKLKVI